MKARLHMESTLVDSIPFQSLSFFMKCNLYYSCKSYHNFQAGIRGRTRKNGSEGGWEREREE